METIREQRFDQERALYGKQDLCVMDCAFQGPADGESAFKEGRNIRVENSFFDLRYPFWHDRNLTITGCELTENCRAALWYSSGITIRQSRLHGIKALRECADVTMEDCDIVSPEFGWSVDGITMNRCTAQSEYFMMRSRVLHFTEVTFQGKYSFQHIEDAVFDNCRFDTKDAFWHAKNVVVKNSVVKGEYLAWYCENVTFENCHIIGTQPLCYCKGLRLINCRMDEADLAFEKSEVQAELTAPLISIKNPYQGRIQVPQVGEIVRDDPAAQAEICIQSPAGSHCA